MVARSKSEVVDTPPREVLNTSKSLSRSILQRLVACQTSDTLRSQGFRLFSLSQQHPHCFLLTSAAAGPPHGTQHDVLSFPHTTVSADGPPYFEHTIPLLNCTQEVDGKPVTLFAGPTRNGPVVRNSGDIIIPNGLNEPKSSYEWGVRSKYGIKIVGDTIELTRQGSVIFRPRDPAVAVRMVLEGVLLEDGRTVWPNLRFFHNSIAVQKSMRDKVPASAFDTLIAANPKIGAKLRAITPAGSRKAPTFVSTTPTQCFLDRETLSSSVFAGVLDTMSHFLKRTCLSPMLDVPMFETLANSTLRPPPIFLSPPAYIVSFPSLPLVAVPTNDSTSLVVLRSAGGRTLGLWPKASWGPTSGEKGAFCKGNARNCLSTTGARYGDQPNVVNLSDAMIVSFEYREEPQSDVGQIEAKRYIFYAFVKACNPQQGSLCLIFMMFCCLYIIRLKVWRGLSLIPCNGYLTSSRCTTCHDVTLDEIRCSSARRVRKPRLAFQQT
jgi:hypothetical protein